MSNKERIFLVGKIGKSVKFNPSTWGATGGDNEAPTLLRKIAELNPNDKFIIISRNDIDRVRDKVTLPKNLVSVYEGASKEEKLDLNHLHNKLKDTKITGCFLFGGPNSGANIPNKSYKRTDLKKGIKTFSKPLEMFKNYVGPIYQYLNTSNIPWVLISNDPRYTGQGLDLMNKPKKILSQFDETVTMNTYDNWEDQNIVSTEIKSVYAGVEKIFLIDKQAPVPSEKLEKFMIILNEGSNGVKSRYPELKKYVLDYIDDVKIYGKWKHPKTEEDARFQGPRPFEELQKELSSVKYTFIIPIKPGWVTSKWVEMINNGIIPFFHPDYDTQNHCPVLDFLRIKNPQDLHNKIEALEKNPDIYKKLLLSNSFDADDYSGKKLSDKILYEAELVMSEVLNVTL